MDSIEKLGDLVSMLKEKKALLSEINSLTALQKDSINEEDVDKLTLLISEKDVLIKRIVKIDDEFKVAYDGLKAELGVDSLEKSDILPRTLLIELKESTGDILNTIEHINEIDTENRKNAQVLKDKFATEIRRVNSSKQATGAYFNKSSGFQNSYFIDSKK